MLIVHHMTNSNKIYKNMRKIYGIPIDITMIQKVTIVQDVGNFDRC